MVDKIDKQSNLKRGNPAWHKGVSANPAGRPKKEICITSWLKDYSSKRITEPIDPKTLTYAQAAALSIWKAAAKGGLSEYNLIVERTEGKLIQGVDMTSKGEAIKQSPIYNIVSQDTRLLLEQLEHDNRKTNIQLNNDISPEPCQLSEPASPPVTE
jgi:hypothetical protein